MLNPSVDLADNAAWIQASTWRPRSPLEGRPRRVGQSRARRPAGRPSHSLSGGTSRGAAHTVGGTMTTDLTGDFGLGEDEFEWDVFLPDPDEAEIASEAAALQNEDELDLDDSDFDWEAALREDSEPEAGSDGAARADAAYDRIVATVRRSFEEPEPEADRTGDVEPEPVAIPSSETVAAHTIRWEPAPEEAPATPLRWAPEAAAPELDDGDVFEPETWLELQEESPPAAGPEAPAWREANPAPEAAEARIAEMAAMVAAVAVVEAAPTEEVESEPELLSDATALPGRHRHFESARHGPRPRQEVPHEERVRQRRQKPGVHRNHRVGMCCARCDCRCRGHVRAAACGLDRPVGAQRSPRLFHCGDRAHSVGHRRRRFGHDVGHCGLFVVGDLPDAIERREDRQPLRLVSAALRDPSVGEQGPRRGPVGQRPARRRRYDRMCGSSTPSTDCHPCNSAPFSSSSTPMPPSSRRP